ncbi:MAG: energy-coupling factor ABC transporter ATP-binding protein [Cyanobacteriota bacterium]
MIYKLKDIIYNYGSRKVLDIKNLQIEEGNIHVVSGANGSGKTTLLKIFNALIKVPKGIILFKDKPVEKDNIKLVRNNTVYVHQNPILFSGNVSDNVGYGLKIRKFPKDKIDQTVQQVLNLVGLQNFESRKSNNLSTGEIKRVAIARALAINPEVLILDEPNAHMDRQSLEQIEQTFKDINKIHNTTIIISSHDSSFNNQIAHNIIMLEKGEIVS